MPDDGLLDTRIREARGRCSRSEGSDNDWLMLILDRQCGKLDRITDSLGESAKNAHKIADTVAETNEVVRRFAFDRRLVLFAFVALATVGGAAGLVGALVRLAW